MTKLEEALKEIIHCIQLAYNHYQRPFSISEYKDLARDKDLVGYDYALYHSRKTWRELLQIAGVPTTKPGRNPTRIYTKDDILDAIIKAAKVQGSFPTLREYLKLAPKYKLPNRVIILKFGSWSELKKGAESKILKDN